MALAFLRGSRLVAMLGEIAMRAARWDGWALLSTAGNLTEREAPAELENLRDRFGHSNLNGVLVATELFDVAEEPTSGGGTRTVYRINERYELHPQRGPTARGPEHEDEKSAQKAPGILSPVTPTTETG